PNRSIVRPRSIRPPSLMPAAGRKFALAAASAQPHSSHCTPCHVHRQCPWQPRGVGSACPQLLPIEPIALDRHCADALAHLVPSPLVAGVVDAAIDTREAGLLAQILPRACRLPPAG